MFSDWQGLCKARASSPCDHGQDGRDTRAIDFFSISPKKILIYGIFCLQKLSDRCKIRLLNPLKQWLSKRDNCHGGKL